MGRHRRSVNARRAAVEARTSRRGWPGCTELVATAVADAPQARVELRGFTCRRGAGGAAPGKRPWSRAKHRRRRCSPRSPRKLWAAAEGRLHGGEPVRRGRPGHGRRWLGPGPTPVRPLTIGLPASNPRDETSTRWYSRQDSRPGSMTMAPPWARSPTSPATGSTARPVGRADQRGRSALGRHGIAGSRGESLPADTEARLAAFTEMVATAIADAQARVELRPGSPRSRRRCAGSPRWWPAERRRRRCSGRSPRRPRARLLGADSTVMSRYDPGRRGHRSSVSGTGPSVRLGLFRSASGWGSGGGGGGGGWGGGGGGAVWVVVVCGRGVCLL